MYKIYFLVFSTLLLVSCSSQNESENSIKSSCLVEDHNSGEIVICFEGNSDFVKSRCDINQEKGGPKVTYSTNKSCPRDRGYYGYCVLDGGEYIPFSYDSPSVLETFTTQKQKDMNVEIVHKGAIKTCNDLGGEWH